MSTVAVEAGLPPLETSDEIRVVFRRFSGGTPFGTYGHHVRFVIVLPLDPIPDEIRTSEESKWVYREEMGGFFLFPHDGTRNVVADLFHGHSGGWDRWNQAVMSLTNYGFRVREC